MSKFVRAAQTTQSLAVAAMEEASRHGLREADLEHLFLALVINDQDAGRALRESGITLDAARQAVATQHESQLATLGIETSFPSAGPIVFHETDGYQWAPRVNALFARANDKGKNGDAAAVLRELVAEPSGLIAGVLGRLDTSADAVLARLDVPTQDAPTPIAPQRPAWASNSHEAFIPAPIDRVWDYIADPANIPSWETGVGSIDGAEQPSVAGSVWHGLAPETKPNGKPVNINPRWRRREITLVAARHPDAVAWRVTTPDAARPREFLTEFALAEATGGTQLRITMSWGKPRGWRAALGAPLRPLRGFLVWIALFHTASAISRAFR